MRLILIRHGQTDYNVARLIQGSGVDAPLNNLGHTQAKKVGQRFADISIDYIYSSDQTRAAQTMQYIADHHQNIAPILHPLLRERSAGVFEGKHYRYYDFFRKIARSAWHNFRPWGGESMEQLQKRVVVWYEEIKGKHAGETIVVVTHGAVINALSLHIMEKELTSENAKSVAAKNTAVFEFHHTDSGIEVVRINCVQHLAD